MRRDQLDLTLLQPWLLIHDVSDQGICRKHARVRGAPVVPDLPVPNKNNQRPNPFVQSTILLDDPIHLSRISPGLFQRVFLFWKTADEESLAVSKSDLSAAASKLRLDGENSRRADNDMIDIETVTSQIMSDAVSVAAKIVEDFRYAELTSFAADQSPRFWDEAQICDRRHPGDDNRKSQPEIRREPDLLPMGKPNKPKHARDENEKRQIVVNETIPFLAE